mmetsp:Transcript_19871/g.47319  ORF Transcript_19871/g.47319 Transcript_19871/m.47319 type:complete len:890 (-) Transcript_19871:2547-5216(-)
MTSIMPLTTAIAKEAVSTSTSSGGGTTTSKANTVTPPTIDSASKKAGAAGKKSSQPLLRHSKTMSSSSSQHVKKKTVPQHAAAVANPNESMDAAKQKEEERIVAAASAAAAAVLKIKNEPSSPPLVRAPKPSQAKKHKNPTDDLSSGVNSRYCLSPINSTTLPSGDEKKGTEGDDNDFTGYPGVMDKLGVDTAAAASDDFVPQSPPRSSATLAHNDVSTPTDFAVDYGKGNSFDTTSNVLAWLQSPTANGLFSPGGGLGSLLNSPPTRTPRANNTTPTVSSTSFFFSDVASLPKTGDGATSPKSQGGATDRNGSSTNNTKKRGISNIICISPLASTRGAGGAKTPEKSAANTPMLNFRDIFASPNERSLPLLDDGETPSRPPRARSKGGRVSGTRDPSVDAVHLAERELLEDEDLSVLLQLASNHTPVVVGSSEAARGAGDSAPVFRSPKAGEGDDFPGNLELPVIGSNAEANDDGKSRKGRLLQKKSNGTLLMGNDAETFGPPTLSMRSSSSQLGGDLKFASGSSKNGAKNNNDGKKSASPSKKGGEAPDETTSSSCNKNDKSKPTAGVSKSTGGSSVANGNPYPSMGHPYPPVHGDMHGYYPLPSGMPPMAPGSTGSMRVVMGGPPPRRTASNGSSKPGSPGPGGSSSPPPPPGYHEYPPPPGPGNMPYPPPPGMFATYPSYNGMGRYPPSYNHYPPPPPCQMPMYNAQHPSGASKDTKRKNVKGSKALGKRPPSNAGEAPKQPPETLSAAAPAAKKQKKSPGHSRKKKSPQLTDRGDREKAAATIQAVNAASGGKNDRAAALAAAILRGVTMRPSGKWQAQLYFAGKSRYIGVFDTREKAALAYEIAREKLKSGPQEGGDSAKSTENLVNAARKAAFDGVNEKLPK